MFTSDHIYSLTTLRKQFPKVAKQIHQSGMPILITRKSSYPLALVDAREFEALVHFRHKVVSSGLMHLLEDASEEDDFNTPIS